MSLLKKVTTIVGIFTKSNTRIKNKNKTAGQHRHIFRRNTNILINNCPQLKTRLLFKIKFAKVFYNHQFHHRFPYSMHDISFRIFCLSTGKFRWGKHRCIRKFRVSEKFYASERWEGVSRFSVENFLCHGAENFRRGESFKVSLIPDIENVWIREGGGDIARFSVETFFFRTVPRNFVWETFCAVFQKISASEKFMAKRGGVSRFSAEASLSHSAEKFRNGTLLCCVLETFW